MDALPSTSDGTPESDTPAASRTRIDSARELLSDGGQRRGRASRAGRDSDTGLAAVAHILALFAGLLGPIIIYVVTDDPFVKQNAANATNWQIIFIVYGLAVGLVGMLALLVSPWLTIVIVAGGALVLLALDVVFIILAAIRASNGTAWQYPLTPSIL